MVFVRLGRFDAQGWSDFQQGEPNVPTFEPQSLCNSFSGFSRLAVKHELWLGGKRYGTLDSLQKTSDEFLRVAFNQSFPRFRAVLQNFVGRRKMPTEKPNSVRNYNAHTFTVSQATARVNQNSQQDEVRGLAARSLF
jgi:hypothetical protein